MKKEVVFIISLFVIFISISFVSAEIEISCTGTLSSDLDEIEVGNKKSSNGLRIGVTGADEVNVINRLTADLLIDASKATVSNSSYFQDVDLSDGSHTITFRNATSEKAWIDVDGTAQEIEKGDVVAFGSLFVMLANIDISNSEDPSTKVIIGNQQISLSNDDNPADKVTVGDVDYVVELVSASDSGATIKVYKCDGGDISIVGEEIEEVSEENTTEEVSNDDALPIIDPLIEGMFENQTDVSVVVIMKDKGDASSNEVAVSNLIAMLGDSINLTEESERSFSGSMTKEGFYIIKDNTDILQILNSDEGTEESDVEEKPNIFVRFINWLKGLFGIE